MSIVAKIRREPAIVTTLVGAILVLLVEAGLPISDGLAHAITGTVVAVLAFVVRSRVTPVTHHTPSAPPKTSPPEIKLELDGRAVYRALREYERHTGRK